MNVLTISTVALFWFSGSALAEINVTFPYGPISTRPSKDRGASVDDTNAARNLVRKALDQDVSAPTTVLLLDRSPFGEYRESRALLFDDVVIAVTNGELADTVVVSATVSLDRQSILAIYTQSKPTWVARVGRERDPEAEAEKFDWNVHAAGDDSLTSSVADVLRAVWRNYGIRPSEPGQIILRPRLATTTVPRISRGSSGVEMDATGYSLGVAWIVEVLGIRRDVTPSFYWTGYLILVDDRSGEPVKGLSMP